MCISLVKKMSNQFSSTMFKNECINIYPNFESYNYEKNNGKIIKYPNVNCEEDNSSKSCTRKTLKTKTQIEDINFKSSKKVFSNLPGLDIGILVEEMYKKIEKTSIGPWQILNKQDINNIWSLLSSYIRENLVINKSVYIPNLGTFRVYNHDIDIGNNYITKTSYPTFSVELKFAKLHKLNYVSRINYYQPCDSLNYSKLSKKSSYPRDVLQHIIEKSILAISNKIRETDEIIIIHFPTLGTMSITKDLNKNISKSHRAEDKVISFEFCHGLL